LKVVVGSALVWSSCRVMAGESDQSAADALWSKLAAMSRDATRQQAAVRERRIRQAGVELRPWYCVAPIGDENEYGFFSRCFANVFPPEKAVVSAGREPIDLNRTYEDGRLRWIRHPEWIDGFFHQLPAGPPPARNETAYLYRTIIVKNDATLKAHIVAEDAIRVWLDGKVVGEAAREGNARYKRFLDVQLPLRQGENRLLIKVTSFHGSHGFGFALPEITGSSDFRPSRGGASGTHALPANLRSTENRLHGGNRPYASAREGGRRLLPLV